MGTPPLVTVLMPIYNGEAYLRLAVDSILSQVFTDFELLLINDGSTDGSAAILESYADPRIRLYHNETNLKLTATLNKGISLARGQYIARMDCDDIALPQRLNKQVIFMQQHPDIGILGTNYRVINSEGEPGTTSHYPTEHGLIRWRLIFGSYIAHPTVMMRTDVIHQLGGYRPGIVAEDYDLWQRAAWHTRLANLPDCLHLLRKLASSASRVQYTQVYASSIATSLAVMTAILGHEVRGFSENPLSLATQIHNWRFESSKAASQAAYLLYDLAQASAADTSLTSHEHHLVCNDAARWLTHIFRKHRTLSTLILAVKLDPYLPLRLPGWVIHWFTDPSH